MRVAIVSDFYLDYVGGAQSSILEQKASLEALGHSVLLIAPARGLSEPVTDAAGEGLHVRPAYTVPGVVLPVVRNRPPMVATLRDYFVTNEVDVVHLQTEFGLAHAATTAAHEVGLRVIHTVHTFYWQSSGLLPTLVAPVMRALLQNITRASFPKGSHSRRPSDNVLRNLTVAMALRADAVVSPSAHQARDLEAAGVDDVTVVPNPIARSLRPASLLTAEQASSPRILWVARCEPEKRPIVFVRAVLTALDRTNGGFAVDFVGDGSELAEVRRLTAGRAQFTTHGSLGHDTVLDLIDAASVVALTSYEFDNQPMTIAESVSRYRGVLFCDPKLREGLGDSGYLSRTPDEAALADAIVELVTSPSRLIQLSLGAERDARTFAAATYVERITEVYRGPGYLA